MQAKPHPGPAGAGVAHAEDAGAVLVLFKSCLASTGASDRGGFHGDMLPALSVRRRGPDGEDEWVPVFSALNLPLVKELAGPGHDSHIDGLLALAGLAPAAEPIIRRVRRR